MARRSRDDDCLLCVTEDAADSAVVFRDELWAAEVLPGYEVPGWVVLRVRRHAERITALSDDEVDSFGRRARDLVAAVTEVNGTPATYLLAFGETYPHFHVLVVPRGDDVPDDHRAGDILKLLPQRVDPVAARAMVPALRAALAGIRQRRISAEVASALVVAP